MTNGKPSEVKRDSDFSVTVVFPSCRLASAFEREMQSRALLADGGKGEAVATLHDDGYWTWKKGTTPPYESSYAGWRMDVYAAPQAECAPREAQPVAVKAAIPEGDYDLDWIKACAPTPERADAGKDAALKQALDALKQGKQFIVNGVEFGFIRMPEPGDPALYTLPTINAAIDAILAANKEK